jgi:acetoin utilization protein AcuB
MLVGERMSRSVISLSPDLPIAEAMSLMKREHIRRAPVVKDGQMIGLVSEKDLANAAPSSATSLSVWELNYLLSKVTIKDVMTKNVITVSEDTPIEEAARLMADNKIGGLPVCRDGAVVGIITETDLFKIFLELMGVRDQGVRVTAQISDVTGTLARLTQAIAEAGGNFVAFGQFAGESVASRLITFKVTGMSEDQLRAVIQPFVLRITDLQTRA